MSEILKNTIDSEVSLYLRALETAIDTRLIGEVVPQPVLDEQGRVTGVLYRAQIGKESLPGEHDWHQVSLVIPEDIHGSRRYSMTAGSPLDDPMRWVAGQEAAGYMERPMMGRPKEKEIDVDTLFHLSEIIADGRLIDPSNERVEYVIEDHEGVVVSREKIVPVVNTSKRRRLSRLFGAFGLKKNSNLEK